MIEVTCTPALFDQHDRVWYLWPLVQWNQGLIRKGSRVYRRDHLQFRPLFLRLTIQAQYELPRALVRHLKLLDRLQDADASPPA